MAYATRQDLIDRFGATEIIQRTDRSNRPATTIDDTVVARALADAQALVDGYIGKVYELPLATVPPVLTKVCCDLARLNLWAGAADKDGPVSRAADAAVAWAKDVARGLVRLDVAGITPPQASGGGVKVAGAPKIFSSDSLRGL